MSKDHEIIAYKTSKAWRAWLSKNHQTSDGIWMQIFKKNSGEQSITYSEALDEALCFGWIDSQKKSYDENSYLQRFSPRRTGSVWSKVNIGHIERLTAANKMNAAGLKLVEQAKKNGQWERAYDSPSKASIPEDFLKELRKNKKAESFFKNLNKINLYSIVWRLQTAKKPETRIKRIKSIIEMLSHGKKLHG